MRWVILALISIFLLINTAVASVTVDSNVSIIIGNVTISFSSEQTFDSLYDNGTYVVFNDSKFFVSSNNPVNLSVNYYLTGYTKYSFTVSSDDPSSVVEFRILTGNPNAKYLIYRNGSLYSSVTTDANGWLNWTYEGGFSTWVFTFQPSSPVTPTPTPTPTPTKTTTPPPTVPPILPEKPEFIDFVIGFLTENWWIIAIVVAVVLIVYLLFKD